jgi:hypothetical protein
MDATIASALRRLLGRNDRALPSGRRRQPAARTPAGSFDEAREKPAAWFVFIDELFRMPLHGHEKWMVAA